MLKPLADVVRERLQMGRVGIVAQHMRDVFLWHAHASELARGGVDLSAAQCGIIGVDRCINPSFGGLHDLDALGGLLWRRLSGLRWLLLRRAPLRLLLRLISGERIVLEGVDEGLVYESLTSKPQ